MRTTQRQPSVATRRLTRMIAKELHTMACEAFGWTIPQWARKARCANATVYRLIGGQTRFVRFDTLVKLASAVGQELYLQDRGMAIIRSKSQPKRGRRVETRLVSK